MNDYFKKSRIMKTLPHFDYTNGWNWEFSCSLLGKYGSHPRSFYDTLKDGERKSKKTWVLGKVDIAGYEIKHWRIFLGHYKMLNLQ